MENSSEVTSLILTAYDDLGKMKYFYFSCILLLYLTIVFANITLISLIFVDSSLHEPMYLFLCNLFVNELYGSTAFFPVVLFLASSDTREMSRIYCSLQVFCLYTYGTTEIYNLAVMSYDRYLSICHPLHYSSRMNPCKVYALILFTWFFSLIKCAVVVALQLRLPLCGNIVHKLYCTNYGLVKLSCSDTTINNIYGVFSTLLSVAVPFIPILYSYSNIIQICFKSSKEAQAKALSTCIPQVISFVSFSICGFFEVVQNRFDMKFVPKVILNAFTVYLLACPQILNPVMYGVRLTKIRNAFRRKFFPNRGSESLAAGLIRASSLPTGTGFFFVERKDKSLLPCIDYGGLNDIMVQNHYPIPLISSAFSSLQN
ncbi:olfactory receptor 1J21-like [Conger conger]|uniref:olfactory receptor 1J21-like n=1 Tax=Conger conger TaxID=82655 RepID=UPI002A59876C|nr:olfactory receptor 1J21-like [Conger conger]